MTIAETLARYVAYGAHVYHTESANDFLHATINALAEGAVKARHCDDDSSAVVLDDLCEALGAYVVDDYVDSAEMQAKNERALKFARELF